MSVQVARPFDRVVFLASTVLSEFAIHGVSPKKGDALRMIATSGFTGTRLIFNVLKNLREWTVLSVGACLQTDGRSGPGPADRGEQRDRERHGAFPAAFLRPWGIDCCWVCPINVYLLCVLMKKNKV